MSEVPLRWLARADVLQLGGADFAMATSDVREVVAMLRAGTAQMPAELSLPLDTGRVYALPARVGDVVGLKWTAHRGASGNGAPAILSFTLVNDAATGRPIGAVESGLLTAMRTAAVSAIVLREAAPAPLRRVALLGAGLQARTHLCMLATMFPEITAVALWNRTPQRTTAMLAEVAAPFACSVFARCDDALADADAVLSCTDSAAPFLPADVVRSNRIVLQIGRNEVPFAAIACADAVLVDLWGEFRLTSVKSLFRMHQADLFPADRVAADLAAILLDGWRPASGAAVYFSSFGLNVFDIAIAARVLRRAEQESAGMVVSLAGGDGIWRTQP